MFRSATDLLIDDHHIENVFTYRQLQLKLRILRDQSKYTILTKLNKRKDRLQNAASTVLTYGTQSDSEIERQLSIQSQVEREYESDSEPEPELDLSPQDFEEYAIHNSNLLPDWRDPQYDSLGLREHYQPVRVAYSLPERLHYNENDPVMYTKGRYGGMHRPDTYVDEDLNLAPYATHVNYVSDLVTDQNSVSQVLSESEDSDFIEHLYRSEHELQWDLPVLGGSD